jgi:4-amino-4-deoxy-L-arabinose transferase-like glycosyltransferase
VARERRWLRLGVVLMVVAAGLEIYAYIYSSNGNALEQNDAQVLALAGLAAAVIGAALFVRYSIAQFLRYWLARLTYEQQTQTDRVVDAVKGSS